MLTTEQSDNELLQAMLAGDEEALAALYRRRQGTIYRFALQMSGSHALAEDVTQEVFMVLMRDGVNFDSTRGSVSAFMLGIARNHVLRRLRQQHSIVSLGDESDESHPDALAIDSPLDDLSRSETVKAVRCAVLSLPARYREVVILCDLQELSYAEAAAVLTCAVGTVRSRLHRGRSLLIEKLRPVAEEETLEPATRSARCFA